jgi:hypothetical protein
MTVNFEDDIGDEMGKSSLPEQPFYVPSKSESKESS